MTQGKRSKWRTYKVLGHTLTASVHIVTASLRNQLSVEKTQKILERWENRIFDTAHIQLEILGKEHLTKDAQVLLMSNHLSLLDVPSVLKAAPCPVRAISKQELRRVPVFGRALEAMGTIFVDRKNLAHAKEQLKQGKKTLKENGVSLWVAAEGTRSRDGRLLKFKKGGFHLAQQLEMPIVPTWISGTLDVIPPDQWESVTHKTVSVSFGAPIETAGRSKDDIEELMRETRTAMLDLARNVGDDDVDTEADV
ncbi:MAG: 1-acyl-sn-glycerol-3-phosphate acyltransferase [Deltaproteobacteria bacterium]|nr:1-acyl-sn-glycerol-3-phosphate acyltransferase [Deltaproteobacteria bacterium]